MGELVTEAFATAFLMPADGPNSRSRSKECRSLYKFSSVHEDFPFVLEVRLMNRPSADMVEAPEHASAMVWQ